MSMDEQNIKKWLEGRMSGPEKELFGKTDEFRSFEKLLHAVNWFRAPEYDKESGFSRLRPDEAGKVRKTPVFSIKPLLQVAAVLTLILGLSYYFLYDPNEIFKTGIAEKTELTLPDSSLVILNASSRLSYNPGRWAKNRKVKLEGEAFFRVTKGSKFEVETISGQVGVLGTQFNVKNRKSFYEVGCYEGAVRVRNVNQDIDLSPRQMFRVINGIGTIISISVEDLPAWLGSESSFQSVPFREVMAEFERQYEVKFRNIDSGTGSKLFTGRFTHADMALALKSICIPFNLSLEISKDHYIILSPDRE
jgi:ferric-dicitrate binding protein FerR (iron transport regulator)